MSNYSKYQDALFGLRCAPDLLACGLFPNMKEWTEAYGLYWHARQYLGSDTLGRRDVLVLDVGCGSKPRLGALVACMTRWTVVAIDPRLRIRERCATPHPKIHGLTMYPMKIEEVPEPFVHDGLVVSFHCHSHAPLPAVAAKVCAKRHVVIALPCCNKLDLPGLEKVRDFEDEQITSPKRRVLMWDIQPALAAEARRLIGGAE